MSSSCVRRSVRRLISRTRISYGLCRAPRRSRAYSAEADRFIAELDEEYYLHYAGLKDRLELEDIYERHSMLTQLENVQSVGEAVDGDRRVRELWQFGCEGYLGKFTREHAEKLAELEAELEVNVDGETVPFRMIRPDDGQRGRPRPARAARPRDVGGDRGAPEPGLPRRRRHRPPRAALARDHDLRRALRALRLPPQGARRAVRGVPRRHRAALRGAHGPSLAGAAPALAGRPRALGRAAPAALAAVGRGLPRRQDGAGAAGDTGRPRDRPRQPAEHQARHRAAATEDAARVLLADRGARTR